MRPDLARTVAIVGAAESDEIGLTPNKSALMHHAEAGYNALADAGLKHQRRRRPVHGRLQHPGDGRVHGHQADATRTSTSVGGSSFVIHIAHAIAAINAGYCNVALVTHGQVGRSARGRAGRRRRPARPAVRDALRHDRRADQLRHGLQPLHAPVRRGPHPPGLGRDRRRDAQVGLDEPQGDDARPDVVRRLPQLALDRLALPPARLLSRHRRRRRHRHHHGRRGRATCRRSRSGSSAPPSTTTTR